MIAIIGNTKTGPAPSIRDIVLLIGINKHKIPIQIIGIDQTINFLAPYALMSNQFSSDWKAFEIRTPYQSFLFTLRFIKGMLIVMKKKPHEMFKMARSNLSSIILISFLMPNIIDYVSA